MPTKQEGRPRDASISRAIIQAAEKRMESLGFDKLTVDGIVNDVGTTRQAFYRRYKSMSILALEILLTRFGGQDEVDSGSLEGDLLALQLSDVAMMTTPLIQKNLPGLLEDIRTDADTREIYLERMILPRRKNIQAVLERAQARKEIPAETIDHEYVCDLLFGPLLSRVLLPTGLPIDEHLAQKTVATVMREF
ncbi:TetR/AcrR family transcriptional regulator [Glutamicibacter nicotianae]|uniref:TetR/AcrR family transcriptional regulator n=1 Tax=Glutamicibacter nicotianae TaxID=37929 RepID=UPI000EF88C06|nr:TetR/AcrR family transcriptional regulator [Glutamicibacter nicotianae]